MVILEPLLNWMSWICSVSFCPEVSSWSGSQVFTRTVMGPLWPPYQVSLNTARPPSYTLAWSVAMVIVGELGVWAWAGRGWEGVSGHGQTPDHGYCQEQKPSRYVVANHSWSPSTATRVNSRKYLPADHRSACWGSSRSELVLYSSKMRFGPSVVFGYGRFD